MIVLGITGGVGCGKSTVLEYIKKNYNADIVEMDAVGKKVMDKDEEAYTEIVNLFGKEILNVDMTINRAHLAQIVFEDTKKLEQLNGIVHPAVRKRVTETVENSTKQVVLLESAILLEAGYESMCNQIWYVFAKREVRIKRLMESRGYDIKRIENTMLNQAGEEYYKTHADAIIDNSEKFKNTCQQIDYLFESFSIKKDNDNHI